MSAIVRNLQKSVIMNSYLMKKDFNLLRSIMSLKSLDVSLLFLSEQKMREYNMTYREKESSTDILSFPCLLDTISEAAVANPGHEACLSERIHVEEWNLGDIYLCPATIMKKYDLKECEIRKATVPLMTHGLLHLCGYLHDNELQFSIMKSLVQHRGHTLFVRFVLGQRYYAVIPKVTS